MKRPRSRSLVLITCLTLYLALITFGGCADRMLLHPSRDTIDARGAARVEFTRPDGGIIEAWNARSPGAQTQDAEALVLEFTGNATRAEQVAIYVASRWGTHSIESWTVNYPGYGTSTGDAELRAIPPMALEAYDALDKQSDGRPIIVCGNSMGTTAALYVAANRHVAGLILQNPPPLRQLLLEHYGWWNLWLAAGPIAWQVPSDLDSIANGRRCNAPAVIFTSDDDELVPPAYHRLVIDAYAGPKRVVHLQGGHNSAADQSDQFHDALDWLWAEVKSRH